MKVHDLLEMTDTDRQQIAAERKFAASTGNAVIQKSLLKLFLQWLDEHGFPNRPTTDTWGTQVVQVKVQQHWVAINASKPFKYHYTIDRRLRPQLQQFLQEMREKALTQVAQGVSELPESVNQQVAEGAGDVVPVQQALDQIAQKLQEVEAALIEARAIGATLPSLFKQHIHNGRVHNLDTPSEYAIWVNLENIKDMHSVSRGLRDTKQTVAAVRSQLDVYKQNK